jgi:sulfotransferase family protein
MRLPNFVVIGAAKAGTTALYWYLQEHHEVFMSPLKETNFFAYGVDGDGRLLYGDPELHRFPIKSLDDYADLFAGAGDEKAVGEASPIYLECPEAAGRIQKLLPGVRIICGLRDPVDRAYSDYLMYLRNRGRRFEPEKELHASARWAKPDSHWMQLGLYHDQLARYYELFPQRNIHVFLFDDLRASEGEVVRDIYRFLEIDEEFVPDFDTPHNVGGVPVRMWLERFLTNRSLQRVAERIVPKAASDRVRAFRMRNMDKVPPLPASLRSELVEYFQNDLAKTGGLIGKDLSHWC